MPIIRTKAGGFFGFGEFDAPSDTTFQGLFTLMFAGPGAMACIKALLAQEQRTLPAGVCFPIHRHLLLAGIKLASAW